MDIKRIYRGLDHAYTKIKSWLNEKKFAAYGTRVKYMFFREKRSDVLIVSFPAFAPQNTARYNYMRTLLPYKCNKLFLLDDFTSNHRGCYLIEENVEQCTTELIKSIVQKVGGANLSTRLIFIGSSKGGYSALNFSFLIPGVDVVIGAPQYFLGSYLDKGKTQENLRYIIGDITEDGKEKLNNRLRNRIKTSTIRPENVYLHYSIAEHTYDDHVKDMLNDLKTAGINVFEDIHTYPNHGGLKDFFPPFITKTISKLIYNERN